MSLSITVTFLLQLIMKTSHTDLTTEASVFEQHQPATRRAAGMGMPALVSTSNHQPQLQPNRMAGQPQAGTAGSAHVSAQCAAGGDTGGESRGESHHHQQSEGWQEPVADLPAVFAAPLGVERDFPDEPGGPDAPPGFVFASGEPFDPLLRDDPEARPHDTCAGPSVGSPSGTGGTPRLLRPPTATRAAVQRQAPTTGRMCPLSPRLENPARRQSLVHCYEQPGSTSTAPRRKKRQTSSAAAAAATAAAAAAVEGGDEMEHMWPAVIKIPKSAMTPALAHMTHLGVRYEIALDMMRFIVARHRIHRQKLEGRQDDASLVKLLGSESKLAILRNKSFCNVVRVLDRVSSYTVSEIIRPCAVKHDLPAMLFNLIIMRAYVNDATRFAFLGLQDCECPRETPASVLFLCCVVFLLLCASATALTSWCRLQTSRLTLSSLFARSSGASHSVAATRSKTYRTRHTMSVHSANTERRGMRAALGPRSGTPQSSLLMSPNGSPQPCTRCCTSRVQRRRFRFSRRLLGSRRSQRTTSLWTWGTTTAGCAMKTNSTTSARAPSLLSITCGENRTSGGGGLCGPRRLRAQQSGWTNGAARSSIEIRPGRTTAVLWRFGGAMGRQPRTL